MKHARLLVSLIGLTLVACQDHQPAAPLLPEGPVFDIKDGHVGGNPGFFFLAPIRKLSDDATVPHTGFNPNLAPVIEVYECSGTNTTGCVLPLGALKSRITKTSGTPLLNRLYVFPAFQEYGTLWDTRNLALRTDRTYRIQVSVGGQVLGYADVDVVRTIKEAARVDRDDFVPLLQNFILPIRFWIGNNAFCTGACASKTITLAEGGTVALAAAGEQFKFDIRAGTSATSGGTAVTEVTFNLSVCEGIDVDLPKVGQCLRVTTLFGGAGTTAALQLSRAALISMCTFVPEEGQEGLVTLHQQDGDLIRALPHARPNCEAPIPSPRLGARGWRWLREFAGRILTPKPLYAGSRTALLHLGGGGETSKLGATCTPAPSPSPSPLPGMALAACVPGLAPFMVTPFPTQGHTISDFQFALPAKMEYVNPDDANRTAPAGTELATAVRVTDWSNAPVQGATITFTKPAFEGPGIVIGTANSNADGIALVPWPIVAGTNTLVASGRGVAAQNNYPNGIVKPFMPDIFSGVPQTPVTVGIGAINFLATGVTSAPRLDQQNLLDGSLGGQGIGRFNDINGEPDPNGTLFDHQDAQTFTAGFSGQLTAIKVPLINTSGATAGVTMQIVAVVDGVPDETHSLGEITIPATAISTEPDDRFNPAAWANFDLTSLKITVAQGQEFAFIVRSFTTTAYLFNPEFSSGYASGRGYRRNRALSAEWSNTEADFGFQTFVIAN